MDPDFEKIFFIPAFSDQGGGTICPNELSKEELELHNAKLEVTEGFWVIMHQLEDEGIIPLAGIVLHGDHE